MIPLKLEEVTTLKAVLKWSGGLSNARLLKELRLASDLISALPTPEELQELAALCLAMARRLDAGGS